MEPSVRARLWLIAGAAAEVVLFIAEAPFLLVAGVPVLCVILALRALWKGRQ